VSQLPAPIALAVQAVPLYHAVELLRQLTTGAVGPSLAGHAGYLVLAGTTGLAVAMRRLERTLVK
jgi:lipooligosaccharide transport system permease protein